MFVTTDEMLQATGLKRQHLDYCRRKNPGLKPLRMVGASYIWAPEAIELLKATRARLRAWTKKGV